MKKSRRFLAALSSAVLVTSFASAAYAGQLPVVSDLSIQQTRQEPIITETGIGDNPINIAVRNFWVLSDNTYGYEINYSINTAHVYKMEIRTSPTQDYQAIYNTHGAFANTNCTGNLYFEIRVTMNGRMVYTKCVSYTHNANPSNPT